MKGYSSAFSNQNASTSNLNNGIDFNPAGSKSVRNIESIQTISEKHSLPNSSCANSVIRNYKDGKLSTERYYGENGQPYLDIDYTNHGNSKTHPVVPHEHKITVKNEKIIREKKGTAIKK